MRSYLLEEAGAIRVGRAEGVLADSLELVGLEDGLDLIGDLHALFDMPWMVVKMMSLACDVVNLMYATTTKN